MASVGTVRVYSKELVEEFLEDDHFEVETRRSVHLKKGSKKELSRAERRLRDKRDDARTKYQRQKEKMKKKIEAWMQKAKAREEQKFQNTMQMVHDELGFVKEKIDPLLNANETLRLRKKKELYEQWVHDVYDPIYDQIDAHVQNISSERREERKRAFFDEFIKTGNNKLLFRDIILEDEYNPMEAHKYTGKYSMKNIRDPLKKGMIERREEAKLEAKKEAKSFKPRQLAKRNDWQKFEETLVRTEMESTDKNYSPGFMGQDHYNVFKSQDLVKKEYFRGGKRAMPHGQESNIPGLSTKCAS